MATYISQINAGGQTNVPIGSSLYGTCATAAGTVQKDVTLANFDTLITGVTVHVKFTNSNSIANPTLKVGSTAAKSIMRYGTTAPSTAVKTSWQAGAVISFTYDGTYWIMNDWLNNDTTYSSLTPASGNTAVSLCTRGEKYTWNTGANLATTVNTALNGVSFTVVGTV